jgi:hypothetical protein
MGLGFSLDRVVTMDQNKRSFTRTTFAGIEVTIVIRKDGYWVGSSGFVPFVWEKRAAEPVYIDTLQHVAETTNENAVMIDAMRSAPKWMALDLRESAEIYFRRHPPNPQDLDQLNAVLKPEELNGIKDMVR